MSIFWVLSSTILAGVSSSPVNVYSALCNTTTRSPLHQVPRFPKNASDYNLTIPNDLTLRYLAVGVGTQNYTCSLISGTPTWNLHGAMAHLRDISNTLEDPPLISNQAIKHQSETSLIPYTQIGMHYFIPHPSLPAPGFFFERNKEPCSNITKEEFVIGSKIGAMPSPNHPKHNVPWLALKGIEGDAAQMIFRTNTHLGVASPPENCLTEGEEAHMRYSALYWFYG